MSVAAVAPAVARRTGRGKPNGESEDFVWTSVGAGSTFVVVGDFARAQGSADYARGAPAILDQIAARLRDASLPPHEWPRALLYEFGNRLYRDNSRQGTERRCSAVALAIHGDRLVVTQRGDVRVALWRNGRLVYPLGNRWRQIAPVDDVMAGGEIARALPDAFGSDEVETPLSILQLETRLAGVSLVLCATDGLEDGLPPNTMAELLGADAIADPAALAERLAGRSFTADGADDVSLVIIPGPFLAEADPIAALMTRLTAAEQQLRTLDVGMRQLTADGTRSAIASLDEWTRKRELLTNELSLLDRQLAELQRETRTLRDQLRPADRMGRGRPSARQSRATPLFSSAIVRGERLPWFIVATVLVIVAAWFGIARMLDDERAAIAPPDSALTAPAAAVPDSVARQRDTAAGRTADTATRVGAPAPGGVRP